MPKRPKRPSSDPAHDGTDDIIRQLEAKISKEYAQAHKEVTEKLDDYLRRYAVKEKKWRQWVAEGKKTEAEYKQWAKGQVMMGKRWEAVKDELAEDYVHAAEIAQHIIDGSMPDVYALNHNYATWEIESGLGIDTNYTLYDRDTVEFLLSENPNLYKRPGRDIQKQIRDGLLKKWEKGRIQSVMLQGILQGESIPNLTKRLERVTGGDHKSAIRNARTMATGVENAGRIASYHRANAMGIPTKKEWVATLDSRTRHWHRQLDGVAIDVDESFENEFGKIKYPGDPSADGANVYNCRCTLIAVLPGHEIDLSDLSLRHHKNLEHASYEEWKADKESISHEITKQEKIAQLMKERYIWEYKNL